MNVYTKMRKKYPNLLVVSIFVILMAGSFTCFDYASRNDDIYIKTHYIYCQVVGKEDKSTRLYCKQEPSHNIISVNDPNLYFNTPIGAWLKTEPKVSSLPSNNSIFTTLGLLLLIAPFIYVLFCIMEIL